jgi:hypothetical protein
MRRPTLAGTLLALLAGLLCARRADAQVVSADVPAPAPPDDKGVQEGAPPESERRPKIPFRGSAIALDNSVSTQTLGIGSDYQSSNPTWEVALGFRGIYRLWEQVDERSVLVGGSVALIREMTNSDTTTERGEWTLTDAELLLGYSQKLAESGPYRTDLLLAAPTLSLPTSQASANNGKILGLGLSASLTQTLPVREGHTFLPQARLRGRLGYTYQFVRAIVPTNDEIERVTVDPLGNTVPSDQLNGAAFSQHQGNIAVAFGLDFLENLSFDTDLGFRPSYKYALPDETICGVVLTGCVEPSSVSDPQNFTVITVFQSELALNAPKPFTFSIGYQNVSLQLGPDGQRRNVLYSPDARFFASVALQLDQVYDASASTVPAREQARREGEHERF